MSVEVQKQMKGWGRPDARVADGRAAGAGAVDVDGAAMAAVTKGASPLGVRRHMSLQARMFLLITIVVIAISAASFLLTRSVLSESLSAQVESRAQALASYAAARSVDPVLTNDIFELNELLEDTASSNANLTYLFIVNPDGGMLASWPHGRTIAAELMAANAPRAEANGEGAKHESTLMLATDQGVVCDVAVSLFDEDNYQLRLGVSYDEVAEFISFITIRWLITTAIVLAVVLSVAFVMTRRALSPLRELAVLTESVSKGEHRHAEEGHIDDEIGMLAKSFNRMVDELQSSDELRSTYIDELQEKDRLSSMLYAKLVTAQEDERKRIARELHDETSHSLTAMLIEIKELEREVNLSKEQRRRVESLKSIVAQTLASVKELAWDLRPSVLDQLGLEVSLERYVEETQARSGIPIDLVVNDDGSRLAPDIETTIYRLVQEAVTNALKYAQAHAMGITLVVSAECVSTMIEDDGVGFDIEGIRALQRENHLGLLGMEERVMLLGGTFKIEAVPGAGTTILARIPRGNQGGGNGTSHSARG